MPEHRCCMAYRCRNQPVGSMDAFCGKIKSVRRRTCSTTAIASRGPAKSAMIFSSFTSERLKQPLGSVVWGDARATSDCKLLAFVLDDVVVCRSIVKDFIRLLSIISSGTRSCP